MAINKNSNNKLIVGLDIGSSKISVVICERTEVNGIEVTGVSEKPTQGMQRGMVSNIDLMVQSIEQALVEAEMMSGRSIEKVYTGITGAHIRSCNSSGVVAIRGEEVTQDDVNRVIEAARAVRKSSDETILHVLPQGFTIDDHTGIRNPIGLCGIRLEVNVHVVTANTSAVQNIRKCINQCDLEVNQIMLDHIASGHSVLTKDEMELGVGLLDIGDGTADLAVYCDGAIQYSASFPMAGAQVTNDIAVILHTPTESAKKIKHRYGHAMVSELETDDAIGLPTIGDQELGSVRQRYLAKVVEARMQEIFKTIDSHLTENEFLGMMRSGMVLTGGTSRLAGIDSLARNVFNTPVRLGLPQYQGALSEIIRHPKFATGIGLCQYGFENEQRQISMHIEDENTFGATFISRMFEGFRRPQRQLESGVVTAQPTSRIRGWFQGEY